MSMKHVVGLMISTAMWASPAAIARDYVVEMHMSSDLRVASITEDTSVARIGAVITELTTEVADHLAAHGTAASGDPFTRYHAYDPGGGTARIEVGLPVAEAVPDGERVRVARLVEGPYLSTVHAGDYTSLSAGEAALRRWAADNHWIPFGPAIQFYRVAPGEDPRPESWRTELWLPVRHASNADQVEPK